MRKAFVVCSMAVAAQAYAGLIDTSPESGMRALLGAGLLAVFLLRLRRR